MDADNPKCRIISCDPTEAENWINELWHDYHLMTINLFEIDGHPWVTAVMIHRSELPRPQNMIQVPLPGFRQ